MAAERTAKAAAGIMAILLVAGSLLLSACGSSASSDVNFVGDAYPNILPSNTRYTGGPINSDTVSQLEVAWTVPLEAKSTYGSYSSAPVVAGEVIYSQDLASNVQAIDLKSGDVLWEKSYENPDQGPNGVVVADGRVYGATSKAAFALDQKSGEELWSVPLARNEHEGIDMAPGYEKGVVYVSTVPGTATEFYEGEGVGKLWALDAKTGKKLWHFDTVPESLWSKAHTTINSGGGLWYAPAFDGRGSMYFGVGNPAPFPGTGKYPWGSSRPGPNLYTNSIVKMDAKSGKMDWYFQLTPHDVYDWDLQGPPILATIGGRELVLAAGKSGIVIALNAKSGKLVWKQPVGTHNGHDDDGLYAMRGEYSKLKTPMEVSPGNLGGVIAPMSTDGNHVFAPVVNHAVTIASPSEVQESSPLTGELVALDAKSGAIKWQHEFASAAFGATTAVNDVVFTTTYDGRIYAFDASSGRLIWQEALPAGSNTGVTVIGDTVIAPAGLAAAEGQSPQIVAYRLGG
ncbi:MAG TPA: PQQ-binding-like beta-propeller repeat protein [Solirubrobacterales bacterium]|jgi:outer membrane protein assembly factor BamB|nr:PQQ-binding-like beta-propeller repeat protein [Solirubrobacterales bacterium]